MTLPSSINHNLSGCFKYSKKSAWLLVTPETNASLGSRLRAIWVTRLHGRGFPHARWADQDAVKVGKHPLPEIDVDIACERSGNHGQKGAHQDLVFAFGILARQEDVVLDDRVLRPHARRLPGGRRRRLRPGFFVFGFGRQACRFILHIVVRKASEVRKACRLLRQAGRWPRAIAVAAGLPLQVLVAASKTIAWDSLSLSKSQSWISGWLISHPTTSDFAMSKGWPRSGQCCMPPGMRHAVRKSLVSVNANEGRRLRFFGVVIIKVHGETVLAHDGVL